MPHAIDTVEYDPQTSSVLEEQPLRLHDTRPLAPRVPEAKPRSARRWILVGLGLVLIAVIALSWGLYARHFESTDDAQIEGHLNLVSSRISGTVLYVNPQAENNQYVEAGTLLVEMDPSDYQAALDHSRAAVIDCMAFSPSALDVKLVSTKPDCVF